MLTGGGQLVARGGGTWGGVFPPVNMVIANPLVQKRKLNWGGVEKNNWRLNPTLTARHFSPSPETVTRGKRSLKRPLTSAAAIERDRCLLLFPDTMLSYSGAHTKHQPSDNVAYVMRIDPVYWPTTTPCILTAAALFSSSGVLQTTSHFELI